MSCRGGGGESPRIASARVGNTNLQPKLVTLVTSGVGQAPSRFRVTGHLPANMSSHGQAWYCSDSTSVSPPASSLSLWQSASSHNTSQVIYNLTPPQVIKNNPTGQKPSDPISGHQSQAKFYSPCPLFLRDAFISLFLRWVGEHTPAFSSGRIQGFCV